MLLIEVTLRSLMLGIAVALVLTVLRVRSPHLQKSAWTAVLVSALIMPALMRAPGPIVEAPSYAFVLLPTAIAPATSGPMRPSVAAIYGVVALLMFARYGLSLARIMRIRRKARCVIEPWAADFDVRVTAELLAPATFGATILLPEEHVRWSTQKRQAIMAHERSHVLARDSQRLWIANLYKCLFWLNPLAWWLERRIAVLAEETSDAAALLAVGDAPAYAEVLLEFAAASRRTATVVAGMSLRPSISARIERIVGGKAAVDEPGAWRRFAAAAGVVPAMFLCATLQLAPNHWAFAHERAAMEGHSSAEGLTADKPRILSWPDQLSQFYPPQAQRAGIDGSVSLAVTLNDAGRVTDTKILAEKPFRFGFGAAASAAARAMKYSNPTGRAAEVRFRIRFALYHEHSPARPRSGE